MRYTFTKELRFYDDEERLVSFDIRPERRTVSIGVTDSSGRSTNTIDVPWKECKKLFQNILDEIHTAEEQEE